MIKFVTSNRHKFDEVDHLFKSSGIRLEWNNQKYEEIQADTTEEVSVDSCWKLQKVVEGDFFIEDTGLYIEDLNGFPGVYSSYVQKTIGNAGIIRLLSGRPSKAHFRTVITLCEQGRLMQFSGELQGSISDSEAGDGGFGYDPIFIPEGEGRSLAEMKTDEKNSISHRYRATAKLIEHINR